MVVLISLASFSLTEFTIFVSVYVENQIEPYLHQGSTHRTLGKRSVIPYDSYVSPIDKAWIWFDRNLFESINVPVSSHQYHLDPFLFFEILKPIPNLNFYVLVFFWSNQNYFESKEEVLISNEKFNWYQFGSEAHPALMIHFDTDDISDSISLWSINRNPHHHLASYFH